MSARKWLKAVQFTILWFGMLVVSIPLYITVSTALKTPAETAASFLAPPSGLYWGNFAEIAGSPRFWNYVWNSVAITAISVVLILVIVPMVSYAISRNPSRRYYTLLYLAILAGIFVPFQVIMLPMAKQMAMLELLNPGGLVIMHVAFALTQGTFLCVGYLKSIPFELDEAAKIDGCGVWRSFAVIILPLMKPILATVLILKSLHIWNDFLLPLLMLNRGNSMWTLPLYIYNFKTEYSFNYNLSFAGFFMSMLPILLVYIVFQRHIIAGLTEGALKH